MDERSVKGIRPPWARENFDRLVAAHNEIDAHMKRVLGMEDSRGYVKVAEKYSKAFLDDLDRSDLLAFARLRNVAVHDERYPDPLFIPSDHAVKRVENLRDKLLGTPSAARRFARKVVTVSPAAKLSSLLEQIKDNDYSQFPVCSNGSIVGLITENGITRWMAHHTGRKGSLIELEDHTVSEVLLFEEFSETWRIVGGEISAALVEIMFREIRTLQAVLVTKNGDASSGLVGIATIWDLVRQRRSD